MKSFRGLVMISVIALLVLLLSYVGLKIWTGWGRAPFDKHVWKAAKTWDFDNIRGTMVRSLLNDHEFTGMTRLEVVELLGPPDGADGQVPDDLWVPPEVCAAAATFYYVLGMYSGFRIDHDFLIIYFDENGAVQRAVTQAS